MLEMRQLGLRLSGSPLATEVQDPASQQLTTFLRLGRIYQLRLQWAHIRNRPPLWLLNSDVAYMGPWMDRKRSCPCFTPQACGEDVDYVSSCRSGTRVKQEIDDSSRCQHFILNKSSPHCCKGLKEAARYACNDARLVNTRAREGLVLLAREFVRLDRRARQDVALLGSGFLKLDARARQDTEKLDIDARRKAARLQSMATVLRDKAQTRLKTAADQHWSDGALDADLRLADLRAKRRAMEDAFIALQLVKSIHNGMVKTMPQRQMEAQKNVLAEDLVQGTPEPRTSSYERAAIDRLAALQDAYWEIASALAEADGIDHTDPDELEFIIAALLDMDAVDGASSASLLAECANSPNVATRQALANALGNAPSMWALGNAGMGALQRLAQDGNQAVASAASKALDELKRQWQMDAEDILVFRPGDLLNRLNLENEDDDEGSE